MKQASVGRASGYRSDEKEKENLDGSKKGYICAREVQGGGVVGLEDAERVDVASGVH